MTPTNTINTASYANSVRLGSEPYIGRLTEFNLEQEDAPLSEDQLKVEINTFVWMHAPAAMPLGEADKLALNILGLILEAREKFSTESTE